MPLTFGQFRDQHYLYAKGLLEDRGNSRRVERLCRATFDGLALKERGNVRLVHQKMLTIFHDRYVDDFASPTGRPMRILDKDLEIDPTRSWIPFEQFLDILKPILLKTSLIRRLNAALHILEWGEQHAPNVPIKTLFNAACAAIDPQSLHHLSLPKASAVLTTLRDALCREVAGSCRHEEFLRQLIRGSDDIQLEAETIDDLRTLLSRSPKIRFARDLNPTDRYGWLRERWNEVKGDILRQLDRTKLTTPSRQDKRKADHAE